MFRPRMLALALGAALAASAPAAEPVDEAMVARIRTEAFEHSQVQGLVRHLTETIGPRLTSSPAMARANAWSRQTFERWGLANVRDEAWGSHGIGWEYSTAHLELVEPRRTGLHVVPVAWSPGTAGTLQGDALRVRIRTAADRERYRGKLRGKILLMEDARVPPALAALPLTGRDSAAGELPLESIPGDLYALAKRGAESPLQRQQAAARYLSSVAQRESTEAFLHTEGALGLLYPSRRGNGIIVAEAGTPPKPGEVRLPALMVPVEHYNPLVRAVQGGQRVVLEMDVAARYAGTHSQLSYNTLAEIPGHDRADEIVMLGAHMDSWHSGTGASDNGAGVAVVMEVMRILKSLGVKPKRTIRAALWSGEEQGLLGSIAYVDQHFAAGPEAADQATTSTPLPPSLAADARAAREVDEVLSVYFNMDHGSGRFKGIYAQKNMAAIPIFEAWLKPFADLGATEVNPAATGSTDHIAFDRAGLPGFQFVQDFKDYWSHVHHSHLDTYDHVEEADLQQAAAIMASFVYHAAMRDAPFPRKP